LIHAPFGALTDSRTDARSRIWFRDGTERRGIVGSFDVSGHPAITIPCGRKDRLPIGMMLVGRHFEEATLIRLTSAIEAGDDWTRH